MANLKFSQFQEQTDPANVQFVVGYNGTDNVRIDPANLGGGGSDITQIYRGSMYANQSSVSSYIYMPFTSSSESTNSNQDHAIVAPYNGYVSYIQIKNTATILPTATYIEMDIAIDSGTGNNPSFTSLYSTGNINVTTGMRMEADDTLTSTDATFNAGDLLYFRFKSDGFWQRATFNMVVVYQP
jgi:hypothetical protein